jgi:RHS repeat-associated protein
VWKNGTGIVARYAYDLAGRRIAKRVYSSATGGVTGYTRFVYAGADVAYETDSAGTIGLRYTWGTGTDDLVAIRDTSGNHYYVTQDLLGSVRGLVKQDGTWTRTLRYGAYGAVVFDSAASGAPSWPLRYQWTGREYDAETGFYFHRSRYYAPAQRRFVQEDRIGYEGGPNLYGYAEGRALEARDPLGMSVRMCTWVITSWATISTVAEDDYFHPGTTFTDPSTGFVYVLQTYAQTVKLPYYKYVCFGASGIEDFTGESGSFSGSGGGGGGAGGGAGQASSTPPGPQPQPQPVRQVPSCAHITYQGTAGYIGIQTHSSGRVAWGIYMNDPSDNLGPWFWLVSINGKKHDARWQAYPPHQSIHPNDAPSGSIVSIMAIHVSLQRGAIAISNPNACVVP